MKSPKNNKLFKLVNILKREIIIDKSLKYENQDKKLNIINRREFIDLTAKSAIGITLASSMSSTLISSCSTNKNEKNLDVAIIGAGISGLNCAKHLLNKGINFKVFEANKSIGGRILTHMNDPLGFGVFPEFGGDFIDSNHEDMLALIKEFNLELIDLENFKNENKLEKDIYFFEDRIISENEIITEFKKVSETISKDIESLGKDYDTDKAVELDNISLDFYIESLKCNQWFKDLLKSAFTSEYGLDCNEQSTLNMLCMLDTNTDNGFSVYGESDERFRVKNGNSKIIEKLSEKIGKDNIKTKFQLIEISDTSNNNYKLVFSNGEEIIAKNVVLTIPFTILRDININLKDITSDKLKCINELGYGMNTKLILSYNGMPWRNKPNNAMGYLFHKDIVNGWDSSYNKSSENPYGAYVCYFGGEFSKNLNKKSFKNRLAPKDHSWKNELPETDVQNIINELDKVFLNSKNEFQNKHIFVNWIDYPYTKGSYSCYKVGQWSTISGLEIEPIGNVFFAGEHCSSDFQGFMNGAAETGRKAAESILLNY